MATSIFRCVVTLALSILQDAAGTAFLCVGRIAGFAKMLKGDFGVFFSGSGAFTLVVFLDLAERGHFGRMGPVTVRYCCSIVGCACLFSVDSLLPSIGPRTTRHVYRFVFFLPLW